MSSLLIVGFGYLGEAIEECFLSKGWPVTKVGRSEVSGIELADVSDVESLRALRGRIELPTHIVHCASSGRGGPEAYRAVFEQGVENLIAVFPEAHLMLTSSSSVYAQVDGETVTEESDTLPTRETGQILLRAEQKVLAAGGTVMRLSGIYGDGRSVILKKWLKGESKVEEDGRRMLNQIHRKDAASAFFCVAQSEKRGEIFNVSETHPKSQLETLQWLADKYGRPLPESEPRDLNRKRGWTHKLVSSGKLLDLGWRPEFPTFTDAVASIESSIELG